jgi:predicted transglutaminase-like cysteine proteinase
MPHWNNLQRKKWQISGPLSNHKAKVAELDTGNGQAANVRTIQVMRQIAHKYKSHQTIRQMALNIIKNVPSHHYVEEARAIGEYVKRNVRYVKDAAGIEQLHDPVDMANNITLGKAQGDCDDMVLLTATLLLSVGINPIFRAVRYKSRFGAFNHIYLYVVDNNGDSKKYRLVIDPIMKDKPIGFEVPHKSGKDFVV